MEMKDEEKAEEYRKSLKQRLIDEDNFERLEMFDENVEESFLAGLKAGRPQWHKADVPTSPINKVVLGYIKDYNFKKFCLVMWNGKWWYDAGTYNDRVELIAWCEIPTFDKE